jgi:hypothetical protein
MTAGSWVTGATVLPYLAAGTLTGSPVYGTKGSVTLSGTTYKVLEGEVVINTGLDLHEKEFGSALASDVISSGKWEVTGNLTLAVKKTEVNLLCHARRQVQKDFAIVLGDTAGSIGTIDMNQCEIDPSPLSVPDSGPATVQVPFTALGSTGEDNITFTLT